MKNFKITSELHNIGTDPHATDYDLFSFIVKAEIDGETYTTEYAEMRECAMHIEDEYPRYAYVADYGEHFNTRYEVLTYLTEGTCYEPTFIEETLELFYKGNIVAESAYIVEIGTNEVIAEYHDSENSRSIIINNKEKCYLA